MAPIEWRDNFSVGNAAVDHEHRELIDLVNRLGEVIAEGGETEAVEAAFGDLYRAIAAHFALEEKFMREHGYDRLAEHKEDHERLLDELRDIMDDWRVGEHAAAAELMRRVEAWFVNHFKTHDARLHSRLGDHPH